MRETDNLVLSRPLACLATMAALLAVAIGGAPVEVSAQAAQAEIPDLVGVWNGGFGARPVNGPNMPWTPDNFPVLNERALAFQQVFDEGIAPKYDCVPAASPVGPLIPATCYIWPSRMEKMCRDARTLAGTFIQFSDRQGS